MVGGQRGAGKLGNIADPEVGGKVKCCVTNWQKQAWGKRNIIGYRWGGGMKGCLDPCAVPMLGGWVGSVNENG